MTTRRSVSTTLALRRRQFLRAAGMGALSAVIGACAPTAPGPVQEVVREVEVTRVVERVVEVTRVAAREPSPTKEEGMIFYVDIEHPNALADPARQADFDRVRRQRTQVCAEASDLPAESILYTELTPEIIREKKVRALAISGNTTDWEAYDFATFEPLFNIVRSGQMPTIGFCGGHQLIGLMYNARCDSIRRLKPGEPDPGGFAPGWFKEVGFMPVQVVKDDPIFAGLGSTPTFFESHYWEIKEVPEGFDLLASTENVRVQVIKHKQFLIYGTQFHPEVSSAENRDGFTLLKNFFSML
jgi:GMP synthase-like glutamine amidotransferase